MMLNVIIKDSHEPNVTQLTYENLWKELKDIPDAELTVGEWEIPKTKNRYVCWVEADCLVSSGYFESQLGLLKKNPMFRKIAMMSSSTAVNDWANKFYGYNIGNNYDDGVIPNMIKKSNQVYPVQVAYMPGAIMHIGMLTKALDTIKAKQSWEKDLVYFSTQLSLAFWQQGVGNGVGNRVHINPNSTYVTTETYVNDIGKFEHDGNKLIDMFRGQMI
jgi:hypothetical protein